MPWRRKSIASWGSQPCSRHAPQVRDSQRATTLFCGCGAGGFRHLTGVPQLLGQVSNQEAAF